LGGQINSYMAILSFTTKYREIFKLLVLLEKNNIPHSFTVRGDSKGFQIRVLHEEQNIISVIQHRYSAGEENDLLELIGGSKANARGNITAKKALGIIRREIKRYNELLDL